MTRPTCGWRSRCACRWPPLTRPRPPPPASAAWRCWPLKISDPLPSPLPEMTMQHDKILILDFGSQVTQLIARRVREAHVYCEVHPCDVSSDWVREFAADEIGRASCRERV